MFTVGKVVGNDFNNVRNIQEGYTSTQRVTAAIKSGCSYKGIL